VSLTRRVLKTWSKEAEVTRCDKLFQRRGPATTKDRSPRVERVGVVRRPTSRRESKKVKRFYLLPGKKSLPD